MKGKRTVIACVLVILTFYIISNFVNYNTQKCKNVEKKIYVVKTGDTLSEIAEKHKPENIKTSRFLVEIQLENRINEHIEPGQILKIPAR